MLIHAGCSSKILKHSSFRVARWSFSGFSAVTRCNFPIPFRRPGYPLAASSGAGVTTLLSYPLVIWACEPIRKRTASARTLRYFALLGCGFGKAGRIMKVVTAHTPQFQQFKFDTWHWVFTHHCNSLPLHIAHHCLRMAESTQLLRSSGSAGHILAFSGCVSRCRVSLIQESRLWSSYRPWTTL